jgi:ABC-2 type transport system ATP-binding protein
VVHPEPDAAALSAPSADADRAAEAVGELSQSGIGIATFSLGQPTLDEVFLALTGHAAERNGTTDEETTQTERRAA